MAHPDAAPGDEDEPAAEERFWRGRGAVGTGGGTVPPEPGTTPAELEEEEEAVPASSGRKRTDTD